MNFIGETRWLARRTCGFKRVPSRARPLCTLRHYLFISVCLPARREHFLRIHLVFVLARGPTPPTWTLYVRLNKFAQPAIRFPLFARGGSASSR